MAVPVTRSVPLELDYRVTPAPVLRGITSEFSDTLDVGMPLPACLRKYDCSGRQQGAACRFPVIEWFENMMNSRKFCVVLFPGMLRCSGRRMRVDRRTSDPAYGVTKSGCLGGKSTTLSQASLHLQRGYMACPQAVRRRPSPEPTGRTRAGP